ncbi:MAG: hypothetical protein IPP47_25755 [Bryobacterales bacterium]|nr:hypothetical protein [Bryobacterales bacterium]
MSQDAEAGTDMDFVDALLSNARTLLNTATDSVEQGLGGGDWTVFYGPQGGLQMIAGSEPALASLEWSHGATAAWQVTRSGGRVRVEGLSGDERCLLEAHTKDGLARRLLNDWRMYQVRAA